MTSIDAPPAVQAIELGGQPVWLLPERAAWHPPSRTLFIADLHLGKAAAFRAHGLPVPSGTTQDNLRRIDALMRRWSAARVVLLGDLLHSAHAQQASVIEPVRRWRAAQAAAQCVLVRGNHDAHAGDPPPALDVEIVDEPWHIGGAPGLVACHHPGRVAGAGVLAGHWHPVITLRGAGRDRARLPCFCRIEDVLVLPAFGAFTGGSPHEPPPGSTCYPVGGERVWQAIRIGAGRG
jgi:DNA ligase-associated metallophosphoesterase